jgi:hypothetical protein
MHSADDLSNTKNKKINFMPVMMFLVIVMGLCVGIGSYGIAYRYMMEDSASEPEEERFSANEVLEQAQANLIGSDIDAVVRSKDVDKGNINFYNLKNETSTTVTVADSTIFPKGVSLDTIQVGDIVTYIFDKDRKLTELKECENEWTISDVGVAFNTTAKLVKFTADSKTSSDTSYKYVDGITNLRYKGEIKDLTNLSPLDYVTIHGYDDGKINKVYNIEIVKSHGEIQLHNLNHLNNPEVTMDDKKLDLSSEPRAVLTEGVYNLKVTSDNADTLYKQVTIKPEEPCIVDLSTLSIKTGVLDVSSNVSDYKLVINGKEYTPGESIILDYGTYNIQATKDGYKAVNSTVTINADVNPVSIQMKKLNQQGTINITATPANATITIDGKTVGTGAVTVSKPVGSYVVAVSCSGYTTERKQINISTDQQSINVAFDLKEQ